MIQFLLYPNDKYSLAELAQMAIEGGCGWLQMRTAGMGDAEIKEEVEQIIPLCKETDTILVLEDKPELAREMGVHGVHITLGSGLIPAKVREELGPEAIIGVEVGSIASITGLPAQDMDYATLEGGLSLDEQIDVVGEARGTGMTFPLVVSAEIAPELIPTLKDVGASGFLVGKAIADSDDPVAAAEKFVNAN